MTAPYLDPERKHDFVFLFDVLDGNPNGDPDAGGMPRIDPVTSQGLVSDVAIKRKLRNTVAMIGEAEGHERREIYVRSGTALNTQHGRAYDEGSATGTTSARDWMCRNFFDVRMFGAVMSTGEKTRKAGRVQGPVQLTFSRSVDKITPVEHGITRVTPTRQEDLDAYLNPGQDTDEKKKSKAKETEMGSKHLVPYGLYVGHGHFSAPLARRTGVDEEDLRLFWRAFTLMFDHDRASSRGEMGLRGLYVFTHDDQFGRAPAATLSDLVTVAPRGDAEGLARSFEHYRVTADTERLPAGVTLATLDDVTAGVR